MSAAPTSAAGPGTARPNGLARAWDLLWVRGIGRALAWLLVLPIRGYQLVLSPLLGARCKYHPSCSRYAVGALQAHGPLKGLALGSWRLLRCNPWSKGGVDPVPPRGRWLPDVLPTGAPRPGREPATAATAPENAPADHPHILGA